MQEIYNIWDVSEHRSLNKLVWVSVLAPEGLKPTAKERQSQALACALSSTSSQQNYLCSPISLFQPCCED